jgi:hypothetical protein
MSYSKEKIKMIGKSFGKLKVLNEAGRNKNGHLMYLFLCACGNKKEILGSSVRIGSTKSCGCLHKSKITKHGMDGTKTYKTWISMRNRCKNKKNKRFDDYGGRGISVCDEWSEFSIFLADMGEKPEGMSIDRIDNDKGYSPENCRWATPKEQARNRRSTIMIEHKGEVLFIDDFAAEIGLSESGARKRVLRVYKKNSNGVFIKEEDL